MKKNIIIAVTTILVFTILVIIAVIGIKSLVSRFMWLDATPLPELHSAAYSGDQKRVLKLLKTKDINSHEYDNETPLHWAIKGHQLDTVKLLVEKGADIEANSSGYETVIHTPLFYAAREGNLEIINYLISAGASIEKSPSALSIAVDCGYLDVVSALIELGFDINHRDILGFTPIMDAARSYYLSQYISGKPKVNENYEAVFNLLLENGADITDITQNGYTVLMFAVKSENINVVKTVLEYKVPINHRNKDNRTALFYAREKGRQEIIDLLIKNGAVD